MNSFNVNEYDEDSRKVLVKILREIREQFLVGGGYTQFWFHPTQVSDTTLTEPIIQKWLQVLSNKGVLYFYWPSNGFEYEQNLALFQHRLGDNHKWQSQMFSPFVSGFPPHSFPSFAIDIFDTDLGKLIDLVFKENMWGKFYKDSLSNFYYDATPIDDVNCSQNRKTLLEKFLSSKDHKLSTKEIMTVLSTDDNMTKNRTISGIRKALRTVSHEVEIKSHMSGRSVDYYELTLAK